MTLPKIVSLFSGAGGLDWGFKKAKFDVVYAVDNSKWAIQTHKRNFRGATAVTADLVRLGPAGVLRGLREILVEGEAIGVIGGPPCQGFSRANKSPTANDPRNKLPSLYLDIVKSLQKHYDVRFVLFENVLGIRYVEHEHVFTEILSRFGKLGLISKVAEYCALDFGVPQDRRRVIISAFASQLAADSFTPSMVSARQRSKLTVHGAIGGLPEPAYYRRGLGPTDIPKHPNHWTMQPKSPRFSLPNDMSCSTRSFKRLEWAKPSPTVAYGHREIHVHPNGHRRLSIYEAMKLQGFPDSFVLTGPLSAQVDQVSNAVPPPLARALAVATAAALFKASVQEACEDGSAVA